MSNILKSYLSANLFLQLFALFTWQKSSQSNIYIHMGSCYSRQDKVSEPNNLQFQLSQKIQLQHQDRDHLPKAGTVLNPIKGGSEFKARAQMKSTMEKIESVLSKFSICRQVSSMLEGVAYTSDQAIGLASSIIDGIIAVEKQQEASSKLAIQSVFSEEVTDMVRRQKLFYHGIIQKYFNNKENSPFDKSRIYHTIANIKKDNAIQEKQTNEFKINCIRNNSYKKLSEEQLDQIVQYESIGEQIMRMGNQISFRFKSIEQESQKIHKLLQFCMTKYLEDMQQLKFDLEDEEVMKIAKISRQSCEYYDNGVFLLLAYLVTSAKKLQSQSIAAKDIEHKLQSIIQKISNQYPPGKGLSQQQEHLKVVLQNLQNPTNYRKVSFAHAPTRLISTNKQEEVQKLIVQYAIIALTNKSPFQELVKATCLQRCVYFKTGVKYNPNNSNLKSLTRIKQKMFFKKNHKGERDLSGSIKQNLQREETAYRQSIDQILKQTEVVQFKISDMVRGKCVFLEVTDIIQTVNSIKEFVSRDSRFALAEIESRFTNPLPISDVTLKIIINQQIVAELQLTIQTNAAAYNFAHKIYQLERTKVFSKLKIVHNYFEESNDDFNQLAGKALQLNHIQQNFKAEEISQIKKYFNINQSNSKSFKQIFSSSFQEKKALIPKLKRVIEDNMQNLMLPLFNMSIGIWNKPLGEIINKTLQNNQLSPKLKSVLLSFFFKFFNIPKQNERMQQFCLSQQDQRSKKYMDEYLKKYFSIQTAFNYISENQRIHHRGQQLLEVSFGQIFQGMPIQLTTKGGFVENIVYEENSHEKIQSLREFVNLYFLSRKKQDQFYDQFSYYYRWLEEQAYSNKQIDTTLLMNQSKIIKAQQQLQNNQIRSATRILTEALQVFKIRQEYGKMLECEILLAQCSIKLSKQSVLEEFISNHKKMVIQKSQTLGLQLRGPLYADSTWRIAKYLTKKMKEHKDIKRLLQTFYTMAITEMSRSKGKQFVYGLCEVWKLFNEHGVSYPQIKQNSSVTYVKFQGLGSQGAELLSLTKWNQLLTLDLWGNKIQAADCKHLAKANWQNLQQLDIRGNQIGNGGCEYLVTADWKNLTLLQLGNNQITASDCEQLIKSDWKNLSDIVFMNNPIGDKGCQYLSKCNWKNLTKIGLWRTQITAAGCEFLIQSDWKLLEQLNMGGDKIGNQGCAILARGNWKYLSKLTLCGNQIGDEGCEHLAKADWKELTELFLYQNQIGNIGCEALAKAEWKKMSMLLLYKNNITDQASCQAKFTQASMKVQF